GTAEYWNDATRCENVPGLCGWRSTNTKRGGTGRRPVPPLFVITLSLRRRFADELDFVAIGVVYIHGAAGQHGVLAASRGVARCHERVVLGVELLFGKLERHVVELVS